MLKWGLMLPSRGVLMGMFGPNYLLELADICEAAPAFDGVWAGDSIIAKPRLEALMLLAAIAGRTKRLTLGTAALASFPLRDPLILAVQWASLDQLAGGRTILCGAIGGSPTSGGEFEREFKAFRVQPQDRLARTEELVQLLRLLWTRDHVTYEGRHFHYQDISLVPKPIQQPVPIWLVSNPFQTGKRNLIEQGLRRVARFADGWMTTRLSTEQFTTGWRMIQTYAREFGRDPQSLEPSVCLNINVNPNKGVAMREAKTFLDRYYATNFTETVIDLWCATGSVEECVARTRAFVDAGATYIIMRFAAFDWPTQMRLFLDRIVPAFA
jgi:alkanesulfonate monooxygenase SsuD/methylene tetrahydromethanopterin reductase-like flavin-dependent oxidoreductase (luciferase family)